MAPVYSVDSRKHCPEQSRYAQFLTACLVIMLVLGCDPRDIRRDSIECRQTYDCAYASDAIRTDHVSHKYVDDTLVITLRFTSRHSDTLVSVVNYLWAMVTNHQTDVPGSIGHRSFAFYFLRHPRDSTHMRYYLAEGETNVFKDSSTAVQLLRLPPKSTTFAVVRVPPEELHYVKKSDSYLHRLVFIFREVGSYFREIPGAPLEPVVPEFRESVVLNPTRSAVQYLTRYQKPLVTTPDSRNTLYVTRRFYTAYLRTAEPHRSVVEF